MSYVLQLRQRFAAATTHDERCKLLFAQEKAASPELVTFLLEVAQNREEYDLTRLEAIKSAAHCAYEHPDWAREVADALVFIAVNDSDSDVQNYALQYLKPFKTFHDLPGSIAPTLDDARDFDVRFAAYDVLANQVENPDAVALLEKLRSDPDLGSYVVDTLSSAGR